MIVEVGHIDRAAKHEVLKEVGETSPLGALIARANLIEDIKGSYGRKRIFTNDHTKAVGKSMFFYVNHGMRVYSK